MTNLVQFPGLGLSFEINRVALSIGGRLQDKPPNRKAPMMPP